MCDKPFQTFNNQAFAKDLQLPSTSPISTPHITA